MISEVTEMEKLTLPLSPLKQNWSIVMQRDREAVIKLSEDVADFSLSYSAL